MLVLIVFPLMVKVFVRFPAVGESKVAIRCGLINEVVLSYTKSPLGGDPAPALHRTSVAASWVPGAGSGYETCWTTYPRGLQSMG